MLRNLSIGLILTAVLAACGSARVIRRDQTGGVIQLDGDKSKAMEQANQHMAGHCGPSNYVVESEGEEPIGTDTYSREDTSAQAQSSRSGRTQTADSTTQGQTSTRTAMAWRLHYRCANAGGGGGQMQAPPPGGPGAGGPPPGDPNQPPPPGY